MQHLSFPGDEQLWPGRRVRHVNMCFLNLTLQLRILPFYRLERYMYSRSTPRINPKQASVSPWGEINYGVHQNKQLIASRLSNAGPQNRLAANMCSTIMNHVDSWANVHLNCKLRRPDSRKGGPFCHSKNFKLTPLHRTRHNAVQILQQHVQDDCSQVGRAAVIKHIRWAHALCL
jgi:hypothetical protein